jgi:hypothetical protein
LETLGTWKLLLTLKAKMKNIGNLENLRALKLLPMINPRGSETTTHDESQEEHGNHLTNHPNHGNPRGSETIAHDENQLNHELAVAQER